MKSKAKPPVHVRPRPNLERRNARIVSTFLGIEDHGILTFFLNLEGDGWGQGFGGYFCKGAFLAASVRKILDTLEVDSWEKLPGRNIRVEANSDKVYCIGHYLKDKWYDIDKHSKSRA